MSYNSNTIKLVSAIETTPGTAVAPTAVVPLAPGNLVGIDRSVTKAQDDVKSGRNIAGKNRVMSFDVSGSISQRPRACRGFGHMLYSALGAASPAAVAGVITGTPIDAVISIVYTGSESSCKLEVAGTDLNSYIGELGAEVADNNFGTAGTIDLSAAGFDTITELVAAIDGYADYSCELMNGLGSVASDLIEFSAKQAKNIVAELHAAGANSGLNLVRFYDTGVSAAEKPTLTLHSEGQGANKEYTGVSVSQLAFTGSQGGFVEASADVLGFKEVVTGISDSGLSLERSDGLIFWKGRSFVAGEKYCFTNANGITINNQNGAGVFGQCDDAFRSAHKKGMLALTGNLTTLAEADTEALRTASHNEQGIGLFLAFKGRLVSEASYEYMSVHIPYATMDMAYADNENKLDAEMTFTGHLPYGTSYNNPVEVNLVMEGNLV